MKKQMNKKRILKLSIILTLICLILMGISVVVQAAPEFPLKIGLNVEQADSPQEVATSLQILFILTIISLAPAILIMMTSFTRIIIILAFLRNALGTQQMPPNQVLIGLALFLTLFIMAPIGT